MKLNLLVRLKNCFFLILLLNGYSLVAQRSIGGSCEGCEAALEYDVPIDKLTHEVYMPDWKEKGPRMVLKGKVYKRDGKTPAEGVIIYMYHTDQQGIYKPAAGAKGWGQRHGYIRGWAKTNANGEYVIYTLKPAPYPKEKFAAHIHVTIKEPGKNPYWIDEVLFEGDPYLTSQEKNNDSPRGSFGLIRLTDNKGILEGKRDIVLGLNVPDYY
jgi:protocatechuate 3,4-dioxygenase beta subunit